MEHDQTRKDAPDTRDDLQQPREDDKTAKHETEQDRGDYKYTDWASI